METKNTKIKEELMQIQPPDLIKSLKSVIFK